MTADAPGTPTSHDITPDLPDDSLRGLLGVAQFRGIVITTVLAAATVGSSRFVYVWLIGELTDWDTATAILGIVIGLPPLLLSAWAGSLADRLDPKKLGLGLLVGSTVLFAGTALIVGSDLISVPIAMACAFVTAIGPSMLMPLLQALVPSVVPKERLMKAIALQNLGMMVSMIAGTFVCGALMQAFGTKAGFWFLAVASALAVGRYAIATLPASLDGAGANTDRRGAIREGIRRAMGAEPLRSLLLFSFVMGMATASSMLLLPELARDVLDKDSLAASALTGFMGIGVMVTTLLLAARWTPSRPGLILVSLLSTTLGGGLFAIGASRVYALTALIVFVWGAFGGIVITLLRTLTQLNTPPDLMGRVMGLAAMAQNGAFPVASLMLVVLVNATSIGTAMMISGVIYAAMVWLIAIRSKVPSL